MNLHQLKFLVEASRREFNLTEAAKALHTSQPGISKAILELEAELGVEIFSRHGKRIKGLTEPGLEVLAAAETVLREVGNIKRIGQHYSTHDQGTLRLAATHTQARYVLPQAIAQMRSMYPSVKISLHEGTPDQVAQMVLEETVELGIATEALSMHEALIALPCFDWQHYAVLPSGHALGHWAQQQTPITLEDLAAVPLITYQSGVAGRSKIDDAFAKRNLQPQIVLEAIDSDVIKTYARLGLGVGLVAQMALDPQEEGLTSIPAGHLFGTNTTKVAFKRGVYLRDFVVQFAEFLSERINRKLIEKAVRGSNSYDV